MKAIIVMIASTCLRRMVLIAIASFLAMADAQVPVVVAFSNLTTPNNTGMDVAGSSILTYPSTTLAGSFSANINLNLLDVKVSVAATADDPAFNVWLAPALGGEPNDFRLWRQIGFGLRAPSGGGVVVANSIVPPIALTKGTSYWVVLTPANIHSHILWNLGGSSAIFAGHNHSDPNISFGDSNWFGDGSVPLQLQVDGTPPGPLATPLPPSLILCLTGLAIVGLYKMRWKLIN